MKVYDASCVPLDGWKTAVCLVRMACSAASRSALARLVSMSANPMKTVPSLQRSAWQGSPPTLRSGICSKQPVSKSKPQAAAGWRRTSFSTRVKCTAYSR